MSRITTSSASFSSARAAIRRACWSEVRVCSCPWIACFQCISESWTVKAALRNQRRDRVRHEAVERLARGDSGSHGRRGRRIRLDLEEQDALRATELREHRVELFAWKAGPSCDCDAGSFEHCVRLAPLEEAAELVRADNEDRVVEALG